jgi:hypothetical protein
VLIVCPEPATDLAQLSKRHLVFLSEEMKRPEYNDVSERVDATKRLIKFRVGVFWRDESLPIPNGGTPIHVVQAMPGHDLHVRSSVSGARYYPFTTLRCIAGAIRPSSLQREVRGLPAATPNGFREQIMNSRTRSLKLATAVASTLYMLSLAACSGQSAPSSTSAPPTVSPTRVVARGTALPTTVAATPLSAVTGAPQSTMNSPASASANATISPREVPLGNITLDLSLTPARHMFDGSAAATNPGIPVEPTPPSTSGAGNLSASSAVFGGGMVGIANNIDPSQASPPDSAQSIIRHIVVHVRTNNGQESIPYLGVSLDLLLDGHPILYDVPLEPMTAVDQNALLYYYGNNVKFPQPGSYQLFIRIQPNPILGSNPPPAAQFNVILH